MVKTLHKPSTNMNKPSKFSVLNWVNVNFFFPRSLSGYPMDFSDIGVGLLFHKFPLAHLAYSLLWYNYMPSCLHLQCQLNIAMQHTIAQKHDSSGTDRDTDRHISTNQAKIF